MSCWHSRTIQLNPNLDFLSECNKHIRNVIMVSMLLCSPWSSLQFVTSVTSTFDSYADTLFRPVRQKENDTLEDLLTHFSYACHFPEYILLVLFENSGQSTASSVKSHFPSVHLNFTASCRVTWSKQTRTVLSDWETLGSERHFFVGFHFSLVESRWRRRRSFHSSPRCVRSGNPWDFPVKSLLGICHHAGWSRLPVCVLKALIWPC